MQHKFHDVIQSSTHLHLDAHNCLELITVRGEAKRIKKIKDRLASVPGVRHSDMLITGTLSY